MRRLLASLLVLAYLFALVMSTGHLSEWYRLTLGTLPTWFAVGLAAALEASAFLLSLLSNSLLRGSGWANWGSLVALALVWVGNFFSMVRAGASTGVPTYEVFLASLFVPVSTYVVAKVLGELLGETGTAKAVQPPVPEAPRRYRVEQEEYQEEYRYQEERYAGGTGVNPEGTEGETEELEDKDKGRRVYAALLREPKTVKELVEQLGISRTTVYRQLRDLEARGLVENRQGRWHAVYQEVEA